MSSKSIKQSQNSSITVIASLPEGGENLYNIINQREQYVTINNNNVYIETGKKRPRPADINNIPRDIKKPRYN